MIHLGKQGDLNQIPLFKHTHTSALTDLLPAPPHTRYSDRPLVSPCLLSYRVTEAISSASSAWTQVFKTSGHTQSLLSERVMPVEKRKK